MKLPMEIIRVFHYYGDRKGESEYIALVVKKDVSQSYPYSYR